MTLSEVYRKQEIDTKIAVTIILLFIAILC